VSLVIGDIAGQFDALQRLIAKCPDKSDIILVGDLIDRGPKSRQVIEWAMTTPGVRVIKGNHEDMFVDFVDDQSRYDYGLYFQNGGLLTLGSYGLSYPTPEEAKSAVPREHIRWLRKLPYYIEEGAFFISHAPVFLGRSIDEAKAFADEVESDEQNRVANSGLLWNRDVPIDRPGVIQVFGHNANFGLKWFEKHDGTKYAICLDDSWKGKLTAFDTVTLEIYQEPYEEK